MSIYSHVSEQDLIILRKLEEQEKEQRALKIKNRVLTTHDVKLAESLSPITKNIDTINESSKKIVQIVEDGNKQTPAIENVTATQSLRDTLAFKKTSNDFFKPAETKDRKVFRNGVRIKPVGENKFTIIGKEYDITNSIQEYFTKSSSTTKTLIIDDKETVYQIPKDVSFYNNRHHKGLKATRHKDAMYDLPKAKDQF